LKWLAEGVFREVSSGEAQGCRPADAARLRVGQAKREAPPEAGARRTSCQCRCTSASPRRNCIMYSVRSSQQGQSSGESERRWKQRTRDARDGRGAERLVSCGYAGVKPAGAWI